MKNDDQKTQWLDSQHARKELGVSSCDLAHIRQAGHLRFVKKEMHSAMRKQTYKTSRSPHRTSFREGINDVCSCSGVLSDGTTVFEVPTYCLRSLPFGE